MRIPRTDAGLLAECEVQTFRSSGPGGQNVNRRETAVRLRHLPTGIVVTCQRERSQFRNRQIALTWLRERLEEQNRPVRKRIPTKVPRAERHRRVQAKRHHAERKKLRQKPNPHD